MKIFLPIKIDDIGGTSIFSRKFKEGMENRGHVVQFEPFDDYDVLFVVVSCPFKYVREAKRLKKPIIQRLDGVFYPSTISGWLYPLYNLKAKIIHRFFSNHTIYQSHYSQYCSEKFLGKRKDGNQSLVYNGVDLKKFTAEGPAKKLQEGDALSFVTASRFRRKDQIVPIIEALTHFKETTKKPFTLFVAGTFTGAAATVPKDYAHLPWIKFMGKVSNHDLPAYYRDANAFLFTHQNPPCPNNIIEAMACGLPICGVDDGSMSELTSPGKNSELIPTKGDAFYKERNLDTQAFSRNLEKIIADQTNYSKISAQIAKDRFDIETMLDLYDEAIRKASKK
jgi:glycosyltransferase involved in cell wall biosynthesis